MRSLALALAVAALGLLFGMVIGDRTYSESEAATPTTFSIVMYQRGAVAGCETPIEPGCLLLQFDLSRVPIPDLEARPDGAKGSGKWCDGDRIGYALAYFFFCHEDPGSHPFLNGVRIQLTQYPGSASYLINDKNMAELVNGTAPYRYEQAAIPIDYSYPGASFDLLHCRAGFNGALGGKNRQLLARFIIPPVSPVNSKVKAYYQLGGAVVFIHDTLGSLARLQIASVDNCYEYREARFNPS